MFCAELAVTVSLCAAARQLSLLGDDLSPVGRSLRSIIGAPLAVDAGAAAIRRTAAALGGVELALASSSSALKRSSAAPTRSRPPRSPGSCSSRSASCEDLRRLPTKPLMAANDPKEEVDFKWKNRSLGS